MEKISILKENSGKRLDKFLAQEFFLYTRGEIIRRIKKGEVRVNSQIQKPSYELLEGDEVEIEFPRLFEKNELKGDSTIKIDVIYEDENIVVINKPAGIQVHPSHIVKDKTLVNGLISKYSEIADVHEKGEENNLRPGIVHRLDKDTSGVMIIARNKETFFELKKMFKERNIEKTYLAIVKGKMKEREGIIDKPIARSTTYKKQVIANEKTKTIVRKAVTNYKVLEELKDYSLIEVKPKTGRMHQIRVHLASLGNPIVGDRIYGKNESIAERQMLHAKSIKFNLFGKNYGFSSPVADDMKKFLTDNSSELKYLA